MKTYLMNLVDELDFPPEAKIVISDGYDLINVNDELSAFCTKYESNELDWSEAVNEITVLAEKINLHKYIAHMIFFLCMSKHTLKLYEEKGLDHKLFIDTFSDFRYKLYESYKDHGIWGTSCDPGWYTRFFKLERFALGRLQYEAVPYRGKTPYTKDGITINPGDLVLNTHIPSSGPLTPELIDESFALAHNFFKGNFPDGVTPIVCWSWLLFPKHYNMLSPGSNIVKFMDKFDIVESDNYEGYPMFMRIFNKAYDEDLTRFTPTTSIQRAYLELARKKIPSGCGLGITLYK